MKKNAFIICEYNPFHNGHAYHIAKTRDAGAETVICIMSGNFVQRGGIAFADKAIRAGWAVCGGADLVLELPLPFVLSGAGWFAAGAAKVVGALGVDGTLSFGSGAALPELENFKEIISSPDVQAHVKKICAENHVTYPRALQTALSDLVTPDLLSLLSDPNAVLALEYMRAVPAEAPDVDFYCVKREPGCGHDAEAVSGRFASAKYLRDRILTQTEDLQKDVYAYMPAFVSQSIMEAAVSGMLPLQPDRFSCAAMTRLMSLDADMLRNTNGVRQGIENRILRALATSNDLQSLCDAVKSKRFTHARIRQIVVSAALGIEREDLALPLPYLRVLGMNEQGKRFLKENKERFLLPVVMNLSEAPESRLRELDAFAGKLTEFCRPQPRSNSGDYAGKPYVREKENGSL